MKCELCRGVFGVVPQVDDEYCDVCRTVMDAVEALEWHVLDDRQKAWRHLPTDPRPSRPALSDEEKKYLGGLIRRTTMNTGARVVFAQDDWVFWTTIPTLTFGINTKETRLLIRAPSKGILNPEACR